jgi:hypothetical protein
MRAYGSSVVQEKVMLAQFGANFAAVHSVVRILNQRGCRILAGAALAAVVLGGCVPTTVALVGADPADPTARVAGVGYRSTIAPYTSLRPTAPRSWRGLNEGVAPKPKSDQ